MLATITHAMSLPISVISLVISGRRDYYATLSPPKLRWLTPMTYSLRDQMGQRRPTIAIALSVHNSGAQPAIIEDVALRVMRQKPCWNEAAFQAESLGTDLRYVTVPDIEEHSASMMPLVVEGHNTARFVVAFGQRSTGRWRWSPGSYTVHVFQAEPDNEWRMRTSFGFELLEQEISSVSTNTSMQVATYQRWSQEAWMRRDKFCGLFHDGPGELP